MNTRPIRVLLVDDDEDDYVITRDLLSEIEGRCFELEWEATYDGAIEAIERHQHDVYLLDYRLGERNGLELLREALDNGGRAPMILLTGQGDREIDVEAMRAGAADYLVKGQIGASIMERSIRYAIERARLVAGLEAQVAARTAEIQAEKETSETILRSVGDAIVMSDLEMRIRFVNAAFTSLTGYPAEEVVGKRIEHFLARKLPEQELQSLQLTLSKGEVWRREVTMRRKDSRTYDAALTICPVREANGQLIGYVSSHHDISRLKELDRARSQFITSISHELRTPITNLKLYTDLLRRAKQLEKTEQYLQILEDQTSRLSALIQDILEMTTIDSGDAMAAWENIQLSMVVTAAVNRHHNQAKALDVTLTTGPLPPNLPMVKGDPKRLAQALSELVENAVLFTPACGRVAVETAIIEETDHDWVTIAVHDTGPGITQDEQAHVFDRFFRGSLAQSGHVPGTGLGLSKVKEIMGAHGGRVTVESEVGRGSTFTLWLPGTPAKVKDAAET